MVHDHARSSGVRTQTAPVPDHIYTCPMHPEVRGDAPGMCPECGMRLVPSKRPGKRQGHEQPSPVPAQEGHHQTVQEDARDKHAGHSTQIFLRKFWVSLVLTIPVVASSELAMRVFGWQVENIPRLKFLSLLLSSVVFFYGGWIFLASAWREIRAKLPGMMTLIAIAIATAYTYSAFVTFSGRGEPLFWELTTLITVMLLGHYMEMRSVQSAQGALRELSKLLPDTAEVMRGEETVTVPLRELSVGDRVLVRPGGRVPADGVIAEGASDLNESLVTGESKPVTKKSGDSVIAGTINGDGVLKVNVANIGEQTFLAGVMRMVAEAQASKSRLQLLSDRAALALTVIALGTGAVTLVVWLAVANLGVAVERVVAVLVIACPHALGLAVPLVASISTTLAARNGLLVRQRLALETARLVDVVVFDKTGTLTKGEFGVEEIWPLEGASEDDVLQLAASIDAASEHVIARAIVAEAKKRALPLLSVTGVTALPGQGMKGLRDGETVMVGGLSLLGEREELPLTIRKHVQREDATGKSVVLVRSGAGWIGAIGLSDVIRDESLQAVRALKAMGVRVAMITGDAEDVAAWVGKELGIDEVFARVRPEEKARRITLLQEAGSRVAFVGDGVNDAPALSQADVGIAIGAGTNVAIESAGILLVRNDPRDVVKILRLSRATYRKMLQNLFWATAYNIIALPLAAGVLAHQGLVLQPAVSAIFMSLSTVIVAMNALFLRTLSLTDEFPGE